ncbi:MAG: hypothetical protein P8J87_14410 [Verrucomicrobiales bacterium]|nr:hypothetical protein [Verrucomicrobiales bacterium]
MVDQHISLIDEPPFDIVVARPRGVETLVVVEQRQGFGVAKELPEKPQLTDRGIGDTRLEAGLLRRVVLIPHADVRGQQKRIGDALPQAPATKPHADIDAVITDDGHPFTIDRSFTRMVDELIDRGIEYEIADQPTAFARKSWQVFVFAGEQLVVIDVVTKLRPLQRFL